MTAKSKIWIGTSWKMNKTLDEAQAFARRLVEIDRDGSPNIQRFILPPFTTAREVKATLALTSVKVGAQNMHWAEEGPWTGEISPSMLVDCNLDMVELGHSERREFFAETDEMVGLKTEAAIRHGLIPLICIGETSAQKDSGRTSEVLADQVRSALGRLSPRQKKAPILFAYEPVWAIGEKGTPATSDYADARQGEILSVAEEILGHRPPCLYGGSVYPDNCAELIACPNIDGLFIGRSAWDVEGYLDILTKCATIPASCF
ncbi:triose-phosphate isomerase [uncultured Cohaesibacter sp.]|uniref:triose-phosphate isomerase n=1 Tax=uncultured Cohaesibacter sp. TaxID=1002546 RepID=UPI002AAAC21C|nr:triose-phosphate isomerase [uncultured Cohaesibacter sp.]